MLAKAPARCVPPLGARALSKMPAVQVHPEVTELEKYKIVKRRIMKAEREERMDLTKALTPVKTYMGGFTRPQEIRVSNWWHGGRYLEAGKTYESPSDSAYEPHTVVLLESRYNVVHQLGRADCLEHVVVVCRESDLPEVVRMYNSGGSPEIEAMENARWPWSKQKHQKVHVWWGQDENPVEEARKLWAGEGDGFEVAELEVNKLENEQADIEKERQNIGDILRAEQAREQARKAQAAAAAAKVAGKAGKPIAKNRTRDTSRQLGGSRVRSTSPLRGRVSPKHAAPEPSKARYFHVYTPLRAEDENSTGAADRAQVPLSTWSKPPKEPQDAHDDVVPVYYVERKRQLDDITERKEEEGSLMAELSAGILSEGIAAQTRVREEKIPVEVLHEDGVVRHPSGFEPPTPETEFHPVAAKPNIVEDPLLTTVKLPWDEALAPPEDADAAVAPEVDAGPASQGTSTLKTTRGFHTSAVVCASEASDLPFHVLNTPAPPQEGDSTAAATSAEKDATEEEEAVAAEVLEEEQWELEEEGENANQSQLQVGRGDAKLGSDRKRFLKSTKTEPFWRPVLSATFSTRPLALTFARLSRGLERGIPYYTTIAPEDRKDGKSFSMRMRQQRIRRMRSLLLNIGRLLRGERGGFVGIRFDPSQRGRGIDGEGLAGPIPHDKRVLKIGVGEWVNGAEDLKELIRDEAADAELGDGVQVFGLDEFGVRTDGVAWPVPRMQEVPRLGELAFADTRGATLTKRQQLETVESTIRAHGRKELAMKMAETHPSVYYPPSVRAKVPKAEVEEAVKTSANLAMEDEGARDMPPHETSTEV